MNDFPIFRLTIFLAAGIFLTDTWQLNEGVFPLVLAVGLLVVLGSMVKRCSYRSRWLFGVGAACFMFLIGMSLTAFSWKQVRVNWPAGRKVYVGIVQETPEEKPKSMKCRIKSAGKELLLYLQKDSLSRSLRMGEELVFYAKVVPPRSLDSLSNFDYARYLYHQGIAGTAYVSASSWKRTGRVASLSWKQKALKLREDLMNRYRRWGIREDALPVLSALTLGYKDDLDQETRMAYSQAGISHVLALSGMHIGILWLMLDYLLRPLGLIRKRWWMKELLSIFILWAFAFLVGLEASVVRAVVMCMLMSLGRLAGNRTFSWNTLSVAAFFMLLDHPFYLFDVGFQLSFVAVASILCFYRVFDHLFQIKNAALRSVWGVASVSLAAQLGTAPWVMYYFSCFSVYFLGANLVVAAWVPLILYGSVLMFLLAPFPQCQGWVVNGLNLLVDGLNGLAVWTSGLPYSTISWSGVQPVGILLFYGVLISGLQYHQTRRRKWLIACLAMCAVLLGVHLLIIHFVK